MATHQVVIYPTSFFLSFHHFWSVRWIWMIEMEREEKENQIKSKLYNFWWWQINPSAEMRNKPVAEKELGGRATQESSDWNSGQLVVIVLMDAMYSLSFQCSSWNTKISYHPAWRTTGTVVKTWLWGSYSNFFPFRISFLAVQVSRNNASTIPFY